MAMPPRNSREGKGEEGKKEKERNTSRARRGSSNRARGRKSDDGNAGKSTGGSGSGAGLGVAYSNVNKPDNSNTHVFLESCKDQDIVFVGEPHIFLNKRHVNHPYFQPITRITHNTYVVGFINKKHQHGEAKIPR